MLILILTNGQFLQNAVFSFEKGSKGQNHPSSDSYQPIKKSPQQNSLFLLNWVDSQYSSFLLYPLTPFEKPWKMGWLSSWRGVERPSITISLFWAVLKEITKRCKLDNLLDLCFLCDCFYCIVVFILIIIFIESYITYNWLLFEHGS